LFNLALEHIVRDVGEDRIIELNKNITMLAYADDVVILRNSSQKVGHAMEKLIASNWKMGLTINEKQNTC
jgi:hypothetical protein